MGKLAEMLKGIARNTIALTVTIAAFATAGTVGTVLFHRNPAPQGDLADDALADHAQGASVRHVASVGKKPVIPPKAPSRSSGADAAQSAPSGSQPAESTAQGASNNAGNNGPPAEPIRATGPNNPQSRNLANQAQAAAAASASASGTGTSAATSTDTGSGTGNDGDNPATFASSTDTSSSTTPSSSSTDETLSLISISPSAGLWLGGSTVTITGIDFLTNVPSDVVTVDSGSCSSLNVLNDEYLTCVVPTDTVGTVSVTMTGDSQTATMTSGYTYTDVSTVSTLAGSSGSYGAVPSGSGTASEASVRFRNAVDVVASNTSYIYVADTAHAGTTNNVIQQINMSTGYATVLAGNGAAGAPGAGTANGTSAQLDTISALDLDGTNLYYSTCGVSSTVRLVTLYSPYAVSNIMGDPTGAHNAWADGNGSAAYANCVGGVAHDSNYIYFVDAKNYVIREVTKTSPYTVTTIAGTEGTQGSTDGTGTGAKFYQPWGLTILNNVLYVGDGQAIRTLDLSTLQVSTLAGSTTSSGFTDGTGTAAQFNMTSTGTNGGLIRAMGGVIFVADQNNNAIRMVTTGGVVTTEFGSAASDIDGSIGSAQTNAPSSLFYLPGTGIFFTNATTLRYFY